MSLSPDSSKVSSAATPDQDDRAVHVAPEQERPVDDAWLDEASDESHPPAARARSAIAPATNKNTERSIQARVFANVVTGSRAGDGGAARRSTGGCTSCCTCTPRTARRARNEREPALDRCGRVIVGGRRREHHQQDDRSEEHRFAADEQQGARGDARDHRPVPGGALRSRLHQEVQQCDEQRPRKSASETGNSENHTADGMDDDDEPDRQRPRSVCTPSVRGRPRSFRGCRIAPSAGRPATVWARPRMRFDSRRNSVNPCGCVPNGMSASRIRMLAELT